MYVKILPLILAIAFYQLDIGVDIKVAKEQYHLTFGEAQNITTRDQASSLFNGSIFILDSEWQETKNCKNLQEQIENQKRGKTDETKFTQNKKK
jgi:hypothetical protein